MEGELFSGVSAQGMVDRLCELAVERKASDVHAEPLAEGGRIRLRRHGVMENLGYLSGRRFSSLINCFKVMAHMHLEENRIPQDGSCRRRIAGEEVSFRFSVIPSLYGEAAVMRVLPPYLPFVDGTHLGMLPCQKDLFIRKLKAHHGLILVTGPTGSGKTSTMYAAMRRLTSGKISAFSIEDPVEYHMDGVVQMEVNEKAGLTFARGLRALMRQDPDIIMVGETRDSETASISVRAAITGHLVFSTLHTNDSASSIIRLVDMGLEPYMIANSLVGVVAQRLMRKVCPLCAVAEEPTEEEKEFMERDIPRIMRPRGCRHCNNTGYKGRTAIHEILTIDRTIRDMISSHATVEEIKDYALEHQGMKTLKECGVDLVEAGVTTMEELMKVAYYS